MRNYYLIVMAFFVGTVVRADVVLENYGGTDGTGGAISSGSASSIAYTAGTTGSLESVTLRIYNSSTTTAMSVLLLNFGSTSAAANLNNVSGTRINGTGAALTYGDWQFSLGSGLAVTSGVAGSLYFKLDITDGTANWATTNNSVNVYGGWTGGTTTLPASAQYSLSAVPEPGTMLLGGIAAAAGGAVAWWKRRKQRRDAAALAAGDGA